jgi:hypothetical protein
MKCPAGGALFANGAKAAASAGLVEITAGSSVETAAKHARMGISRMRLRHFTLFMMLQSPYVNP